MSNATTFVDIDIDIDIDIDSAQEIIQIVQAHSPHQIEGPAIRFSLVELSALTGR